MRVAILSVALIASCVHADLVPCGDLLCSAEQACTANGCVDRSRLVACEGIADGDACSVDGTTGNCRDGACATQVCGDGVIDGLEECEGDNLGGATCLTLGFYEPAGLACSSECRFDTATCMGTCGDGTVNGPELCDSIPGDALTCSEVGFDYGSVTCSSALCAPIYDGCSTFGWRERVQNLDTPTWISSHRPGDVYLGSADAYLHHETGASTQVSIPNEVCGFSRDGWASETDEVFVATTTGVCRHTASGWTHFAIGESNTVWGTSSTNVFAAGAELQHFDGTTWTVVPTGIPTDISFSRLVGRGTTMVATLADNTVAISTGGAWQIETLNATGALSRPWISVSGDVYLVADDSLYHRTAGGWQSAKAPAFMEEVWGLGDDAIYAANGNSLWAFDQTSWMRVELPGAIVGWSVLGGSDTHLVFTQPYQRFYESSGYLWSTNDPAVATFAATDPLVWAFDPSHIFLLQAGNVLYLDGNQTHTYDLNRTLRDVWGIDSHLFVPSNGNTLLMFDGNAWTTASGTCDLRKVWGEAIDRVFFASDGQICMWNGTAISSVLSTTFIHDLWGTAATGMYAITPTSLWHLPPGAAPTAWVEELLPDVDPRTMWGDATELLVTFGDRRIYRHPHGGVAWTQVPHDLVRPIEGLSGITGDVFGIVRIDTSGNVDLVHFDGVTWDRVAGPTHIGSPPRDVFSSSAGTWITGPSSLVRMFRPR